MRRHALAAVLSIAAPASVRSQAATACRDSIPVQPSASDVLVDVRVGRYASVSVLARPDGCGGLLVPLAPILSVAGLPATVTPGSVAARLPTGERLSLDARRSVVRHGRAVWQFRPSEIVATADGAIATLPAISRFLGLDVTYDESAATVDIRGGDALPVAQRAMRDARRAARDSARWSAMRETTSEQQSGMSVRARPGVAVDYDMSVQRSTRIVAVTDTGAATAMSPDWTLAGAVGVAVPIADGVIESRWLGRNQLDLESASWTRAWFASTRVSELRLGDVTTAGVRHDVVRGFAITNGALIAPIIATTIRAGGRLPAGWQLDAARAGTDLDLSVSDDGRYALGVPLQVGTTVVDFVANGPQGEQRVFHQSFHTPPSFVTPGKAEYALSAGACTRRVAAIAGASAERECDVAGNAELRYGAGHRLTLRSGVDVMRGGASARSVTRPYAGAGAVLGRSLVLDAAYAPRMSGQAGVASATVRFEPSPALTLAADFASSDLVTVASLSDLNDPGARIPSLRYARGERMTTWFRFAPDAWHDRLSIEGFAAASSYAGAGSTTKRVSAPLRWSIVRLAPYWERNAQNGGRVPVSLLGSEMMLMAPSGTSRLLGATWLRGSFAHSVGRQPEWSGTVTHSERWGRVELTARRDGWRHGTSWTLALVPQLVRAQASSVVAADAAGMASTSQSVRGSVVLDAHSRSVELSGEPARQRGGVAGVVFIDRDGDGRRSPDEPAVRGARLTIGNRLATTDAAGEFESWGDAAHSETIVSVDSMSLESPWWVPARSAIRARVPNGARVSVNVPIVIGGIIEGRISYADSVAANAAHGKVVRLTLAHVEGKTTRALDVYADGTFYESGLHPGTYLISADAASLAGLGLAADSVRVTLRGDGDVGTVATARITVTRAVGP